MCKPKTIAKVTQTDEGTLTEIDRGIYPERRLEVRNSRLAIPRIVAEFRHSQGTAQELVDREVTRIANSVLLAQKDERPHVREAAGRLACSLSMFKTYISESDVLGAAFCGILIGRQDEELRIKMQHEENAMRGQAEHNRGLDRVAEIAGERRERRAEIKAAVEDRIKRRGRHKRPSNTQIFSETAGLFQVSIPTVRRMREKISTL